MRPQAIIFDWGGVLQRTASQAPRHSLDRELGLTPGSVEASVFESEVWKLACIGQCSAARAWETICASMGIGRNDVDEFVTRFFAGDFIDQELIHLIERMRANGMVVGLLSNAPPGYGNRHAPLSHWGLEGLFDRQTFSYQVGALKPDPRPYEAILSALDIPASEALFIDDAQTNVRGARLLGMQAHRFSGVDTLLTTLREARVAGLDPGFC